MILLLKFLPIRPVHLKYSILNDLRDQINYSNCHIMCNLIYINLEYVPRGNYSCFLKYSVKTALFAVPTSF